MAAHEIMVNNSAIHNLVREGKTFQIHSTMQISKHTGMQTLEMAVENLLADKVIGPDEAASYLKKDLNISGKNPVKQDRMNLQNPMGATMGNKLKTQFQQKMGLKKSS